MEMLADRQTKGYCPTQIGPVAERGIPFLDPPDKKLIELVLGGRMTRREIAALLGCPIQTISRRLIRIVTRLHDPMIIALIEQGQLLPEFHRDVGLAYFLRRWSPKQIRQTYGVPEYQLRRMLTYIRGWHAARRSRQ